MVTIARRTAPSWIGSTPTSTTIGAPTSDAEPQAVAEQAEQPEAEQHPGDERDEDRRAVLDDHETQRLAAREPQCPEVGDLDRPRGARERERGRDRERRIGERRERRRRRRPPRAPRVNGEFSIDAIRSARLATSASGDDLEDRRPQVRPGRRRRPEVLRGRRPEPGPAAERPELVAGGDDERLVRGHPRPRVADLGDPELDAVALDDERERAAHADALRAGRHLRRDDRGQRLLAASWSISGGRWTLAVAPAITCS